MRKRKEKREKPLPNPLLKRGKKALPHEGEVGKGLFIINRVK
jgi:hypothetical protein